VGDRADPGPVPGRAGATALLASAGRIRGDRDSVRLLSRLFRTDPEPFNTFVF
jgi:hypothetical protein